MRRALHVLSWPVALVLSCLVAVRAIGLERGTLSVQAMAFYPYLIAASAIPALLLWFGRPAGTGGRRYPRLAAASIATLAVWIGLALIVPRAVPLATYDDTDGSDAITVATLNLLFGRADADQVVDLAARVDLLALQEVTDEALERLAAAGLDAELPHRVVEVRPGAGGSGIWSRHPLEAGDHVPGTFFMPRVGMSHPSRPDISVSVVGVHVVPPVRGALDVWAGELDRLATELRAGIVLGDFNATLDHHAMRQVLDGNGLTDVAAATGDGLSATWPSESSRLPGIAIDHVLIGSNAGASSTEVIEVDGTDHRAVLARVILPLRL